MSLVSSVEAPANVTEAIKKASRATGTNFEYLLKTAGRESSFKTNAKAKTSSASGLFQFIENTWLETVKEEGHRFGLGDYSADIQRSRSGRYQVADAGRRREILALRNDPEVAATMAGAFTRQNAEYMSSRIGREATQGELYMAHFMGPNGAARFIELTSERPDARADIHFPKAARANRAIFYEGGRPRSLAQVHEALVRKHRAAEPAVAPTGAAEARTSSQPARDPNPTEARTAVRPVKVAALAGNMLKLASGSLTDAGLGSIGSWQPIVRPELESVPSPSGEQAPGEAAPVERPAEPSPARRAVRPQEAASPPASPPRHGARSPLRIASSAFGLFQEDFWQRQSMDGS